MSNQNLQPYLTSGISGIGGSIKEAPDDFFVEEIPSYTCENNFTGG